MSLPLLLAVSLLGATGLRAAEPAGTVAVELFTSQGCSSCPPGDEVFHRFWETDGLDQDVVVLSWHVDYWNRLGWTDPFSSPEASSRQRAYARSLGLKSMYTPMMVLNGAAAQVTPGNERRARAALEAARQAPLGPVSIEARLPGEGNTLRVDVAVRLDRRAPAGRVEARVLVFESGHRTAVPLGENTGRTLGNSWVVRAARRAFELRPQPAERRSRSLRIPLDPDWDRSNLGVALLLVDPSSGKILQARRGRVAG